MTVNNGVADLGQKIDWLIKNANLEALKERADAVGGWSKYTQMQIIGEFIGLTRSKMSRLCTGQRAAQEDQLQKLLEYFMTPRSVTRDVFREDFETFKKKLLEAGYGPNAPGIWLDEAQNVDQGLVLLTARDRDDLLSRKKKNGEERGLGWPNRAGPRLRDLVLDNSDAPPTYSLSAAVWAAAPLEQAARVLLLSQNSQGRLRWAPTIGDKTLQPAPDKGLVIVSPGLRVVPPDGQQLLVGLIVQERGARYVPFVENSYSTAPFVTFEEDKILRDLILRPKRPDYLKVMFFRYVVA